MTSYSHDATQTKHENRQTMGTKDTRYCEERFIDRSFLVGEQSQKSPWWIGLRWKLLIIRFLLVPPSLSRKFNSALPINYISERYFEAMSFTLANNIWSVKKL